MTEPPLPPSVAPERTFDGVLGFELHEWDDEHAVGRFAVEDRVRQPFGIVHGGAYAGLAEWIVSVATHSAVADDGQVAMGQTNNTSFLRPVSAGTISAEARCRHRGRTSWVWDVDFTDDQGRLTAVTRVTMAVRPVPTSEAP
jgi:1,4-dihydroxy-2-naphthoyl-CoA hydrolase